MSDARTAREAFKEAAEAVVRLHSRNIVDRGLNGDRSALQVGSDHTRPGLLDDLADAAEHVYGEAAAPRRGRAAAV